MSEDDPIRVEIGDREEFEKLTDLGTTYRQNEGDVVATIVSGTEERVNFVCTDE